MNNTTSAPYFNTTPYFNVQDVLVEFPQRNDKWMPLEYSFIVKASELGRPKTLSDVLDPWNRQIPNTWEKATNEITGKTTSWEATTTVRGFKIKLVVTNE